MKCIGAAARLPAEPLAEQLDDIERRQACSVAMIALWLAVLTWSDARSRFRRCSKSAMIPAVVNLAAHSGGP
jgi:hypothetical protein